ncbi:MAG: FecR domain-containing protein [Bacteroidetes bacterium]|nr:FecR domain-containing protein [Bacteroidota bacterium]
MNEYGYTDPKHRYRLPSELLTSLEQEPEDERAGLQEAWDFAEHALGEEPDEAAFRRLGAEIWQNLEAALEEEAPVTTAPRPRLRLVKAPLRLVNPRALRWVAAVACIALLIAVGTLYTQKPITVVASYGETTPYTLPDGSTLLLNSGTKISYARHFGEEARLVKLVRGEVAFDVTQGEHPLTVQTFNGMVTVLGTEFNVRAWPRDIDPATEVAVEEGTVQLAARHQSSASITLEAGQSARLDRQSDAPVALDEAYTLNALSWHNGGFKFPDHPLGTVVNELERRYDVRVKVSSKISLNTPVAILNDDPDDAEAIIRDICEYKGYEYRAVPGGYQITQPDVE